MSLNPDIKNEKFGYAHELVGDHAEFTQGGRPYKGSIIRYQEPVGKDSQSNIAIADPTALNGERYYPLELMILGRKAARFK